MARRKKKTDSYVLNYTVGNVAKRTGQTRDEVRRWLKRQCRTVTPCPFCGASLTLGTYAVDHMDPISRGGTTRLTNCWLTCQPCNRAKGDLTVNEFKHLLLGLSSPTVDVPDTKYLKRSVLARLKIAGALYKG